MSEWKWIDRKEREPDAREKVLIFFCDGDIDRMAPEAAGRWPWTHWMPIPPAPPKMVTIEISEEAAQEYAAVKIHDFHHDRYQELILACRKALEGKR